jgi:hypothetical protein
MLDLDVRLVPVEPLSTYWIEVQHFSLPMSAISRSLPPPERCLETERIMIKRA